MSRYRLNAWNFNILRYLSISSTKYQAKIFKYLYNTNPALLHRFYATHLSINKIMLVSKSSLNTWVNHPFKESCTSKCLTDKRFPKVPRVTLSVLLFKLQSSSYILFFINRFIMTPLLTGLSRRNMTVSLALTIPF